MTLMIGEQQLLFSMKLTCSGGLLQSIDLLITKIQNYLGLIQSFSVHTMTSQGTRNNYIVPHINVIPKVLKHMKSCLAKGVLIAPYWPSAAFWPCLTDTNSQFKTFVKDVRLQ